MTLVGVINSLGKLVRVREPLSAKASKDPLKVGVDASADNGEQNYQRTILSHKNHAVVVINVTNNKVNFVVITSNKLQDRPNSNLILNSNGRVAVAYVTDVVNLLNIVECYSKKNSKITFSDVAQLNYYLSSLKEMPEI
jgi:hypothetical protein